MALPASGPISVNAVAVEFSKATNMAAFRGVVGAPTSGPISLSYFYGKAAGYRYWKLSFKGDGSGYAAAIEFELYNGVTKLTSPSTGTSTPQTPRFSTTAPYRLVDGDLLGNFVTNEGIYSTPAIAILDLGFWSFATSYKTYARGSQLTTLLVEASADGITYVTIKNSNPGHISDTDGWRTVTL